MAEPYFFSHFLQQLHPLHLHKEIPAFLAERTVAVPVELHYFADFFRDWSGLYKRNQICF